MSQHFKKAGLLLGYHLLFALLALAFYFSFSWFATEKTGAYIYSACTALFYLIAVYSACWHVGKADTSPRSKHKPYLLKGLVIAAMAELPTYLYLAICFVSGNEFLMLGYRLWQFTYIGFMGMTDPWYPSYWLINLPVLAVAFLGYFAGTKGFDITERVLSRIVFKKKS